VSTQYVLVQVFDWLILDQGRGDTKSFSLENIESLSQLGQNVEWDSDC
jgi:hypothetical protein